MKNAIRQDEATCFSMEKIVEGGRYLQLHGCMKIYGIVKGCVTVTISGESRELTECQLAIIDRYEPYSFQPDGNTEIVVASIGVNYIRSVFSLYPGKKMPRWLMDENFNQKILVSMETIFGNPQDATSELKKIGSICHLFSEVIDHYGLEDKTEIPEEDLDLTTGVLQYIYEHYSEKITLEGLAKVFHLSPTALSKKLGKRLGVDLRVFVNDVRVQKTIQMMEDPANKGKAINEIAFACGFSSMTTFYRSYRRNFGFRENSKE